MTPQVRLARTVVTRWALQQAAQGWQPEIPQELVRTKLSFMPDDEPVLETTRISVGALLPKLMAELKKNQGDTYYLNSSSAQHRIFYFLTPRQPIDAFTITISAKHKRALIEIGYTPYKLNGTLDFAKMITEKAESDPELAGLALMRVLRSVLKRINYEASKPPPSSKRVSVPWTPSETVIYGTSA